MMLVGTKHTQVYHKPLGFGLAPLRRILPGGIFFPLLHHSLPHAVLSEGHLKRVQGRNPLSPRWAKAASPPPPAPGT